MKKPVPALFLDRDGVIHREIGYLSDPKQVEFLPGIFEVCKSAQNAGYKLIIITNQSGIARGLYSEADFHHLMHWMLKEFKQRGIRIDAYYFCPHHPIHGIGTYRKECANRKPGPGMLLQAAREHGLDLGQSLLIGDRASDMEAGAAAGIRKCFLLKGTELSPSEILSPHIDISTLQELVPLLLPKFSSFPVQ
jgi:D-glycero-D-manno-heptose 1,7-bisphosphate phosphatase